MARILVVDDDEVVRLLLKYLLEPDGHSIVEAENEVLAIKALTSAPFDLVITDLIMPEKEGFETIVEIRQLFPKQKVIAMTGGGQHRKTEVLKLAKTLGADEILEKPFTAGDLRNAVRGCLEQVSAG